MQRHRFVVLLQNPGTYRQEVMVLHRSGPKTNTGKLSQRIRKTSILVSLLNTPARELLALVYRLVIFVCFGVTLENA